MTYFHKIRFTTTDHSWQVKRDIFKHVLRHILWSHIESARHRRMSGPRVEICAFRYIEKCINMWGSWNTATPRAPVSPSRSKQICETEVVVSALAAVCVLLYVKIYVEAVVVITPNCLFLCAPSLLAVMHSPTLLLWHCPSFLSLCCSVSFNVALWYLFMARSFRMSWLCHRPCLCCKYDFFFLSLSWPCAHD